MGHRVVAIDGPAASGKSSTAQWVAQDLGYRHVDSGALYRAVTAAALRWAGPPADWSATSVLECAQHVTLAPNEGTSFDVQIDGISATEEIRSPRVTTNVPIVAQMQVVRSWVNARVRDVATRFDVVVDGRDMGTAVFPDAELKIYLIADPWERARRRLLQREQRRPTDAEIAAETELLVRRDAADATQTVQARDAILIDTSSLTQAEQVARIVALARAVGGP
jgi:cytidylate kinase